MKRLIFIFFILIFASQALAKPPYPKGSISRGEFSCGDAFYKYMDGYETTLYFQGFNKPQKWITIFALTSPDNSYQISRERTFNWVPLDPATRIGGYWEYDTPDGVHLYLFPKEGTKVDLYTIGSPMTENGFKRLKTPIPFGIGDSENVKREKR